MGQGATVNASPGCDGKTWEYPLNEEGFFILRLFALYAGFITLLLNCLWKKSRFWMQGNLFKFDMVAAG